MLFNSLHFLAFFPVAVGLYFLAPVRVRWAVLLILSYYFYASWQLEYVFLLAASTLIDYIAALGIGAAQSQRGRRVWMAISLATNVGILAFFKYFVFISETIRAVLAPLGVDPGPAVIHPLLPVGISFYTFQTLSYTIEVYRGKFAPERHLGLFALYVSFFPQLVAGPIERPQNLMPQLAAQHRFSGKRTVSGLTRMAWGFFLKLVIADRLAIAVNAVYNNPDGQTAGAIVVATYLFAFQIYADFRGYTDIAIGSARVLGIDLMENFRQPYFATSITDFWKRWHISLSTWFHDYVFVSLGGARRGRARALLNVVIVFLVSGLWHGAAWTYVMSGVLFAVFFVVGHITRPLRNALWERAASGGTRPWVRAARPWIARVIVFHLIAFMWVTFRSISMRSALGFYRQIFTGAGGAQGWSLALGSFETALALTATAVLFLSDRLQSRVSVDDVLLSQPRWVRWSAFYAIASLTLMFAELSLQPFIYFQF